MKKSVVVLATLLVISLAFNIFHTTKPSVTPPQPIEVPQTVEEQKNIIPTKPSPEVPTTPSVPTSQELENVFVNSWANGYFGEKGLYTVNSLNARVRNLTIFPELKDIKILPEPPALHSVSISHYYSDEKTLEIRGDFAVGTDYTVILPEGLLFTVKGKKPEPSVVFTEHSRYYPYSPETENASSVLLPVSSVNMEKCTVSIYRLADRNLALPLVRNKKEYMEKIGEKTFDLPKTINKKVTTLLDVGSLLGERKPGYYKLVLSEEDYSYWYWYDYSQKRCDIIISDLGITLTHSDHSAAVSVHSLNTNLPVAGANIQLISKKFDLIATGTSGEDGAATLLYRQDYKSMDDPPYTLIVSTDNDISCLYLDETNEHSTAAFKNTGREFVDGPEAFLSTERGIYRPGENVELTILIRKTEGTESLALETPAFLQIMDATNKLIAKQTIQTDKNGAATLTVPIPVNANTGTFQAICGLDEKHCWGNTSFQVGDFTPDRIKFTLNSPEYLVCANANQDINCKFTADFYYGAPVSEGMLTVNSYATCAPFPKHWEDYSVGTRNQFHEQIHTNKQWLVKSSGNSFKLFMPSNSKWDVPVALSIVGTITEPTSRPISATSTTILLPTPHFIGLKYNDEKNCIATALLSWIADNDAPEPPVVTANFTYQRKEWNYVTVNGKLDWELEIVGSGDLGQFDVTTAAGEIPLKNLKSGYYCITAKAPQMTTEISFWHYAGDAGSVYSSNPSILTAKADKELYAEGDIAELTVEAISDGFAVVTTGEREVASVFSIPVQKGTNTLKVPLPEKLLTDRCYAAVTLVGTHKEETVRSFALLRFSVDNSGRRLPVEISLPQKTEPSKEVEVTLRAPAGSAVRVWAVDEGILSLTNYKTPDPFAFFFQKHCSAFHSLDIYGELFSNQAIRAPKQIGGDGVDISSRLPKLKLPENTIFTFPIVTMPENGETTLRFTPKDFTGALRVIAVAAGSQHVGSADASITVRDRVVVLPYAPAVVAPEDIFPVRFRIDAKESFPELVPACKITADGKPADAGQFLLSLKLPEGLKQVAQESPLFQGTKAGEAITPFLTLQAERTGEYELEYTLLGPDDIRKEGKIPVNVRAIYPARTFLQTAVVKPGDKWSAQKVENLLSPAQVQVATTPRVSLAECISWLHNYPYECLEQTVSNGFPFLALRKSTLEPFCNHTEARTTPIVVKLLQMRRGALGFTSWPRIQEIWPDASVYAAHFLFAVESPLVDDATKEEIVQFLREAIRTMPNCRAYASYALSYAGRKYAQESANYARAILTTEKKPSLATLLASATLFRTGYATEAAPHLQAATEACVWEIQDNEMFYLFRHNAVRKAIALSILCQHASDSDCIHNLAKELLSSLRGNGYYWGNTHSNAWASTALLLYQERFPASRIQGTIATKDKETPVETDSVFSLETKETEGLVVTNTGNAPIYVTVKTLSESAPQEEKSTVTVVKEILGEDGKSVSTWKAGDLLTIRLSFEAKQPLPDAVIEDRLAGCFEIEDGNLATRQKSLSFQRMNDDYPESMLRPVFQASRADRYLFFTGIPVGKSWVAYKVRVVCDGTFAVPPAHVEDMYLSERQGTSHTAR